MDFDAGRLKPRAVGVQFADEDGRLHQALLNNNKDSEIIISSGAIGSPQLLLLSGIGLKNDLKKHNIPVVLHNKFVGKGMADNPMNSIFIPTKSPPRQSLIETVGITEAGVFIEASSGFGQSPDSIQCHHGIMSAEVWHPSYLLTSSKLRILGCTVRSFLFTQSKMCRLERNAQTIRNILKCVNCKTTHVVISWNTWNTNLAPSTYY
jgi:choline dehydrogenase-like flavoprotein